MGVRCPCASCAAEISSVYPRLPQSVFLRQAARSARLLEPSNLVRFACLATHAIRVGCMHTWQSIMLGMVRYTLETHTPRTPFLHRKMEETGEIAAGSRRLPIIALTAMSLAEDRERAMAVGFDSFLCKPFSQDDLVDSLATWKGGVAQALGSSRHD